jgi:hypothetical protein
MEDEGLGTHLWVGNHSRRLEVDDNPLVLFDVRYANAILLALPPIRIGAQCALVRLGSIICLTRLVSSGPQNRVRGPLQKNYR